MAELDDKVIVTKSKITDIADALREEMSESYEYSLPTMVEKVHELGQGQGSEYTAGVGIDITNRVVSVVDTLMIRGSANGSVTSIDDGADDMPLKSCMVAIEPVQSGSGNPSPTNVRPITGWTECNIKDVGKNRLSMRSVSGVGYNKNIGETLSNLTYGNDWTDNHDGSFSATGNGWYERSIMTDLIPAGNYNLSFTVKGRPTMCIYSVNKDMEIIDKHELANPVIENYTLNSAKTILEDGYFVIYFAIRSISPIKLVEPMIESGSIKTTYESYNGNTYNIQFPSQAGTVYGGTLDVTNGVLIVTDGYIASYNGETLPSTWISSMDVYAEGTTPTTGAEVVYKLATPTTYNLTPTEIKTLLGINNIFADCGDVDVEYVRDATLIINKLLELVSGNNNRTMMKSAVVEKTDEVQEQKKDSVEKASELDA